MGGKEFSAGVDGLANVIEIDDFDDFLDQEQIASWQIPESGRSGCIGASPLDVKSIAGRYAGKL